MSERYVVRPYPLPPLTSNQIIAHIRQPILHYQVIIFSCVIDKSRGGTWLRVMFGAGTEWQGHEIICEQMPGKNSQ
jgi:hypothetical protein